MYAEVAGYAATSEAYHMVVPREDGIEIAKAISLALEDASANPAQVDYVNAHATSTMVGDEIEVRGLRQAFKGRANKLLVNATKSLIGHTLGAAGAIGSIVTILAIDTGLVHPSVNYEDPDPECTLPGISAKVQERRIKVGIANAFGFGSNNGVLIFKKYSPK